MDNLQLHINSHPFRYTVKRIPDSVYSLSVFIRYTHTEFFFKLHNKLYHIQLVSAQFFNKSCRRYDFAFINTKYINNNRTYSLN